MITDCASCGHPPTEHEEGRGYCWRCGCPRFAVQIYVFDACPTEATSINMPRPLYEDLRKLYVSARHVRDRTAVMEQGSRLDWDALKQVRSVYGRLIDNLSSAVTLIEATHGTQKKKA